MSRWLPVISCRRRQACSVVDTTWRIATPVPVETEPLYTDETTQKNSMPIPVLLVELSIYRLAVRL